VSLGDDGSLALLVEGDIGQSHADVVLDLDKVKRTSWLEWGRRPMSRLIASVFNTLRVPLSPCMRIFSNLTVLSSISKVFSSSNLSTR
jgi:hypothetical protein